MRPSSQKKQSLHELKRKRRNKSPKTKRKSNTLKQRLLEYFLKFLWDNSIWYERTWWGTFIVFPHHLINKYAAQWRKPVSAFFSAHYTEYRLELMGDKLFKQIKPDIKIEKTDDFYRLSDSFIYEHTDLNDVEWSERRLYETIFPYKIGWTYRYQVTPYMIHFLYNHQDFVDEVSFYHKKYLYNVTIKKWQTKRRKLEESLKK